MYWLALFLPHLPLAVFLRGVPAPMPFAVVTDARPPRVLAVNRAAARAGVRPGMDLSAAAARVPDLTARPRDADAEARALERLAAWALRFTPQVSPEPPAGLLLEVAGSRGLFGGLTALTRRLRGGLSDLGYPDARLGAAPTPGGAWLLARAGAGEPVETPDGLAGRLAPLPLAVLDLSPRQADDLEAVGIATLGALAALPRAGAVRRFGPEPFRVLDRALGLAPDPRACFTPPPDLEARLPLPAETADREALLFGARRLLAELEGALAARGAGVDTLTLHLVPDGGGEPQAVALGLTAPDRDAATLLGLLKARLERVTLARPVTELRLAPGPAVPLPARDRPLFPGREAHGEDFVPLLERLRARLGEGTVAGLAAVPDHRPERAWRPCPPGEAPPVPAWGPRPLWLLAAPDPLREVDGRPWLGGPLRLVAGPERIESGWWDGADAARDYYRAEDPAGGRHWVFRAHPAGAWFRHGIFA